MAQNILAMTTAASQRVILPQNLDWAMERTSPKRVAAAHWWWREKVKNRNRPFRWLDNGPEDQKKNGSGSLKAGAFSSLEDSMFD